jgi:hypothetical protein
MKAKNDEASAMASSTHRSRRTRHEGVQIFGGYGSSKFPAESSIAT